MAEWERALALYAEAMDIDKPESAPGQLSAVLDAPSGTFGQLVTQYLTDHGGQARIADMARWLVEIGRLPAEAKKSGQNYGRVYTTMLRHPDKYEYVQKGVFRLKEADDPSTPEATE